jgi:hypothetical protein
VLACAALAVIWLDSRGDLVFVDYDIVFLVGEFGMWDFGREMFLLL